jgi:hypothetical protein
MYNYEIKIINIQEVQAGDTVEHNGQLKTVCQNNIHTGFIGITLFGDSYRMGTIPVKKVIFKPA